MYCKYVTEICLPVFFCRYQKQIFKLHKGIFTHYRRAKLCLQISNFTDNDDVKILASSGPFTVIEYQRDLSVTPGDAQTAYFCSAMNVA